MMLSVISIPKYTVRDDGHSLHLLPWALPRLHLHHKGIRSPNPAPVFQKKGGRMESMSEALQEAMLVNMMFTCLLAPAQNQIQIILGPFLGLYHG